MVALLAGLKPGERAATEERLGPQKLT